MTVNATSKNKYRNSNEELVKTLISIVGRHFVLTASHKTEHFRKGFRSGEGEAIAVVMPGTLLEQWEVLKACVGAEKVVIMQAANTGLTEGSTPCGDYDREVVILNTKRMDDIQLLDKGRQVISFPGATLFSLEKLLSPLKRQPHSVIGSSCIGATIVGGVCNNSGGALVERGPSYTELSLFAQVNSQGELELVNHLEIDLGDTPEEILRRLQLREYSHQDIQHNSGKASDTGYIERVRDIEADTPARFNADKSRLYESSGCAGKLAVFAVRLDTYPVSHEEMVFYLGTNSPDTLTKLRRDILGQFKTLPVSAEYLHRSTFDVADKYGKDTVLLIDKLGTEKLPAMFSLKGRIDARINKIRWLPGNLSDRLLQFFSTLWPDLLPRKMRIWRERYEHHLILKMHDDGISQAREYLAEFFNQKNGDYFECTEREAKIAGLHRFAAAGAAIRYKALHENAVEDILALDIALKRNDKSWFETLPDEIDDKLLYKLYYGHFMCHVLHQDYIVKKGANMVDLKSKMLKLLDKRGAEYPAEHNVGHLYTAKADLATFYKKIDPTNAMNPGIGKMSKFKDYSDKPQTAIKHE